MSPESAGSPAQLRISTRTRLCAANAGLFVAPGARSHPERCIETYELIFVRSGVLRLWEEKRQFVLPPQHALILWPNRRHGPGAPYEPRTSFYWLHFYLEPEDTSPDFVPVPQVTQVPQPLRLVELLRRFLDDQENTRLEPNYASVLVKLMLLEIGTQVRGPQFPPQQRRKLLSSLTVKEVSLACGYENPDYFRRMFRRFFDMQPNQFRLLHPQQHTNAT
jgi:AraC-like DNA-binding protein